MYVKLCHRSLLDDRCIASRLSNQKAGAFIRLLTALAVLQFFSAFAYPQEPEEDAVSWLPLTLDQSLQDSLNRVIAHVASRQGCDNILEAKFSENSDPANPKFIVTCSNSDASTLNFVYWKSDVDEDFSGVSYPEKQEKQVYSEAELRRLTLLKLREDNKDLIAGCQTQLNDKVDGNNANYGPENVLIKQRATQPPIVYIEYSAGQSTYSPLYTATCRLDINGEINLTIFQRANP